MELWCVHIFGPDDILPMPSKQLADKVAAKFNATFAILDKEGVEISAKVEPYPYTEESFAAGMDEMANLIVAEWD